ncbi:glycerophosphodiester phosphodiesterase [Modestobacter sp. I12A-02628]|uniref:glycerophosphodiester phosphodiesterase n=1 Tax=Goekera deserti TaxID=2497753 RepID=A0A7K3W985_9ACTN|nr:glycerophosphodiester phosphodiesterase family protein [Goekera deserti]MPQ98727.1 glycerophosphodiester phosphodiesterase [Goekera deserti]NDI49290.1 glycerophosphodiester phosphodiesterase [Goekera deserti]NEL53028.1 glycerophosphodiester phosphodiesterase [Goekera deserti]
MHETDQMVVRTQRRPAAPVVIGHRGAPGYRPEHTMSSYELAIDMGADLIEPDIVLSRDGALIARHENELSLSTDVAAHPEFADRHRTQVVNGKQQTGWFVEDFTLAELRTLRAVEKNPHLRPLNTAYDGTEGILTLADIVALVRRRSTPQRRVRVLAELKHPTWYAEQGMPYTRLVADELRRLDATGEDGPVVLQSFDAAALRWLRAQLGEHGPRMVQLVDDEGDEHDAMVTPAGLREVSTYAQGVGPGKGRVLVRDAEQNLVGVSDLVSQAHRAGLCVFVWTLRAENAYLPLHLRQGTDPAALGDARAEVALLWALGLDGVITDHPDIAVAARAEVTVATRELVTARRGV